jgi:tetratricopeptide (TPR) repeat protein
LMRIWERLVTWSDEEVQSAQLYRRLSETAGLHAAGRAGLWNDPDLQAALDWKEKEQPTELWAELYGGQFDRAMKFLRESQARRDEVRQEKEQQRQHELQQAQELAAERQQRIQEQARAAGRLGRWLIALAVVAACLLVAVIGAGREWRKAKEALKAADVANHQLTEQKAAADAATARAQELLEEATNADREMQLEGLRARDANLNYQFNIAGLEDALISHSDPQESAKWNFGKGQVLIGLSNNDEAGESFSKVLESFPDDEDARTDRGYLRFLSGKPKDALSDFQYIHDYVDRGSPLNNLNLAVTNAAVGNYSKARVSLKNAIDSMRHRDLDG